jgi:hypothetical protein
MKSAWSGLAILLLLPVNSVFARPPQQQQYHEEDPSNVADAARRAREQKKEQPKPAKVWDNDTIPTKPGEVSVIGQTPAAAAAEGNDSAEGPGAKGADAAAKAATAGAEGTDNAAKPANEAASGAASASGTTGAGEPSEKKDGDKLAAEIAEIQADLAAARTQLQTAKADLDVAQRKSNLDSQTYYSKPNYAADKDGAANIDAEKAEVEAKQQQVADAQMRVDQLEAKLSNAR